MLLGSVQEHKTMDPHPDPCIPSATVTEQKLYHFLCRYLSITKWLCKAQDSGSCVGALLGNVQVLCLQVHHLLVQCWLCSCLGNYIKKHFGRLLKPRAARQHLLDHLLQSSVKCGTWPPPQWVRMSQGFWAVSLCVSFYLPPRQCWSSRLYSWCYRRGFWVVQSWGCTEKLGKDVNCSAAPGFFQLKWTNWKGALNLKSSASSANLENEKPQVSGWPWKQGHMLFILHEGESFSVIWKIQGLQPFGSLQVLNVPPSPRDGTKPQFLKLLVSNHLLH